MSETTKLPQPPLFLRIRGLTCYDRSRKSPFINGAAIYANASGSVFYAFLSQDTRLDRRRGLVSGPWDSPEAAEVAAGAMLEYVDPDTSPNASLATLVATSKVPKRPAGRPASTDRMAGIIPSRLGYRVSMHLDGRTQSFGRFATLAHAIARRDEIRAMREADRMASADATALATAERIAARLGRIPGSNEPPPPVVLELAEDNTAVDKVVIRSLDGQYRPLYRVVLPTIAVMGLWTRSGVDEYLAADPHTMNPVYAEIVGTNLKDCKRILRAARLDHNVGEPRRVRAATGPRKPNSNRYRGVYKRADGKFTVMGHHEGKSTYFGIHENEHMAALIYNRKSLELNPNFPNKKLNVVDGDAVYAYQVEETARLEKQAADIKAMMIRGAELQAKAAALRQAALQAGSLAEEEPAPAPAVHPVDDFLPPEHLPLTEDIKPPPAPVQAPAPARQKTAHELAEERIQAKFMALTGRAAPGFESSQPEPDDDDDDGPIVSRLKRDPNVTFDRAAFDNPSDDDFEPGKNVTPEDMRGTIKPGARDDSEHGGDDE